MQLHQSQPNNTVYQTVEASLIILCLDNPENRALLKVAGDLNNSVDSVRAAKNIVDHIKSAREISLRHNIQQSSDVIRSAERKLYLNVNNIGAGNGGQIFAVCESFTAQVYDAFLKFVETNHAAKNQAARKSTNKAGKESKTGRGNKVPANSISWAASLVKLTPTRQLYILQCLTTGTLTVGNVLGIVQTYKCLDVMVDYVDGQIQQQVSEQLQKGSALDDFLSALPQGVEFDRKDDGFVKGLLARFPQALNQVWLETQAKNMQAQLKQHQDEKRRQDKAEREENGTPHQTGRKRHKTGAASGEQADRYQIPLSLLNAMKQRVAGDLFNLMNSAKVNFSAPHFLQLSSLFVEVNPCIFFKKLPQ